MQFRRNLKAGCLQRFQMLLDAANEVGGAVMV